MSELLRIDYEVCIIDSIQTIIYSGHLNSSPGSVSTSSRDYFELMRKKQKSQILLCL